MVSAELAGTIERLNNFAYQQKKAASKVIRYVRRILDVVRPRWVRDNDLIHQLRDCSCIKIPFRRSLTHTATFLGLLSSNVSSGGSSRSTKELSPED